MQASVQEHAPDYLLRGVVCVTLDNRPAFIIIGALSLRYFSLLPILPCGFVCPWEIRSLYAQAEAVEVLDVGRV